MVTEVWWQRIFFFQAEDGIRAGHVTGVQTCALPICFHRPEDLPEPGALVLGEAARDSRQLLLRCEHHVAPGHGDLRGQENRSEERRVGKECRSRWSTDQ